MEAPKSTSSGDLKMMGTAPGNALESGASITTTPTAAVAMAPAPPAAVIEQEDDLSIPVKVGTTCQRKGCGVVFESDEVNRIGDGDGTVCTYHPAPVSPMGNNWQHYFSLNLSQYLGKGARYVKCIGN
jgi:hypothetical protein